MEFNANMQRVFNAVNEYLESLDQVCLFRNEFMFIMKQIKDGELVPAIKSLREYSKKTANAPINEDSVTINAMNQFYLYLKGSATHTKLFEEVRTLGLKEAKDVIDVLRAINY